MLLTLAAGRRALAALAFTVGLLGPVAAGGQFAAPGASDGSSSTRRQAPADTVLIASRPAVAPGTKALRGPVDETRYIVGPGDGFAVTIWTQSPRSVAVPVSPEGDLVIPGVTAVPVAGVTLAEAKERVRAAIGRQYRNVDVGVSLVELRRIEVNVTGNVVNPGTYVASALDPASLVIDVAGGTGPEAGRRNIEVRRRNGSVERLDLVRYERTGALDANPPILDGDVVFVPWTKETIVVDGAVESPDSYDFVAGDTVRTLLEIAGGLRRAARRDSVELRRFVDGRRTEKVVLSLDDPAGWDTPLRDGDQLYVRTTFDWKVAESVTLEGEFRFPGPYGINEGEDRLSDVIARAGGFTERASLTEGQLLRTRGSDPIDVEYERLKQIPVQDMTEREYAYFKSKSRERKGLVVVDFEKLLRGDAAEDRVLSSGDRIVVPPQRATITVSGSVTYPGLITYSPGKRPSHYIELAGGYASGADRGAARVVRGVTGEWEPLSKVREVLPGDEVWVPEKPERNWWQVARETVAFVASVATVYLVIDQATR